jgi:hypothetical protein
MTNICLLNTRWNHRTVILDQNLGFGFRFVGAIKCMSGIFRSHHLVGRVVFFIPTIRPIHDVS